MTVYECDCRNCTYKAICDNGYEYCLAVRTGKQGIHISESWQDDKGKWWDKLSCKYYTTEPRQAVLIAIGGTR